MDTRGGVEDTRLKAKDTKKFRGQGQGHSSRGQGQGPRTQAQVFFRKISLQNFFSGEKGLQKFFFRRSPLEENKKRSLQIFREVSGVFQQNFSGSKNSAVLEPRT